ncbi:NifU-like protein C1709,19c [Schizosaccharomyces pombe 972h-] [Rhizoctonia solani]|uniref:NifU-like protein C1709,19c [Schizosaccharomyces pombe 972h-] n=1 Tax=Rhizoctonia solani TaxID=456999 RepID=A0A0K6GG89_9AGAM|nr:NifU-like protein C1709,19c [Schizosaccharomyces pombe 972h-] [Rhizoctonia solani]
MSSTSFVARTVRNASRSVARLSTKTLHTPTRCLVSRIPVASSSRGITIPTLASQLRPRIDTKYELGRRTMFIQTESTPNDDSLKFIPGVEVMSSGTAEFVDTRSALVSPLAIRLFGIEGVRSVFFGPDFVTVSKDSENTWSTIKPEIYSVIMEHFTSGTPLFRSEEDREAAGPQDTRILDTDSDTVAMIKELLETRVRPSIMEDGGDIEYRGFDEATGIVQVKLKGSCRGCSSSTVTLKTGIERMMMHYIPEVKSVEQVLDQEEAIALDEFAKLERRIQENLKSKKKADSGVAQYMSI